MQFFRAHLREGWLFCPRGDFPVFRKEAEKCNIRKLHSQDFSWGEGLGRGGCMWAEKVQTPCGGMVPRENLRKLGLPLTAFRDCIWWRKMIQSS